MKDSHAKRVRQICEEVLLSEKIYLIIRQLIIIINYIPVLPENNENK